MGEERTREVKIEYNPDEIDEQEDIWDDLEDKLKADVIKKWEITGDK